MKAIHFAILILAGSLMFSCTKQSQIITKTHYPEPINSRSTIGNNYKAGNTTYKVTKNNKNNINNNVKKNKITYVPVVVPSFKNTPNQNISATQIVKTKEKIQISVDKMPLNKFINLVFGKTLNMSYFVDNRVQNRKDLITIKMDKPVTYAHFLDMIKGILSRYNITIQNKNGTMFIIPGRTMQQITVSEFIIGRTVPKSIPNDKLIAAIIPFYYVNVSKYTGLIQRLALSREAQIGVVPLTNSLMITDKAFNIKEAIKIINLFDRLNFERRSIVLISLDYLSPKIFIDKLKKILPLEGIPVSNSIYQPGIIMIPMEQIGSVLVVASKREWINVVSFWKNKLDTITALGKQPRFFVYYPKNRRASDLAKVFSQIGRAIPLNKKQTKAKATFAITSKIKVIVDEGRNALVILAPPSEYEQIKNVLDKLDTLPKEVLVQVTIAEITLTNKLQYGIEWYLKHSGKYSGTLSTVGGLGLGAVGINYSLITNTRKFQALLNAYAHKNLINVISSPRLIVLDNHQAEINIGTQVPIVTSENTSNNVQENGTTSLVRTISYRNTGVILTIRPTINSGGILTLNIHQVVSEPQVNDTSKIDSPLILSRDISTSVVLKSGTTLLLGGLIKKNNSTTINKVPILGDIPILGNIFKNTSKGVTKTELIIEITPYIISNINEAENRTKRFESLLKWFKNESQSNYVTQ